MNNQSSLSRYILVILCVSIVFTALVLVVLNSLLQNKKLSSLRSGIPAVDQVLSGQSYEDGYRAGYNAAREKFMSAPPVPAGMPVYSLSGTIESIGDNSIVIKTQNVDADALVDGAQESRTVLFSTSTKLTVRTQKDADTIQKELAAWTKSQDKDSVPPSPYTQVKTTFKDLKVGQTITVSAKEDIRTKESFTAVEAYLTQATSNK